MEYSHDNSLLASKNRVLSIDENTKALFHYDVNANDVINKVKPKQPEVGLRFDSEHYLATGSQFEIENHLTISAWIYPEAAVGDDRGVIIKGASPSSYYFTLDSSNQLSVYWYEKSPFGYHNTTAKCQAGQWTHVSAVWDETHLRLYINGVLDFEKPCIGIGRKSENVEIGKEVNRRNFKGLISNLGIWNEAKSQEQIQSIMNGYKDTYGLVGFWPMNTDDGDVIYDASKYQSDFAIESGEPKGIGVKSSSYSIMPYEGKFGGGIAIEDSTENLWKNINGRPEKIYPNGTTPPIAELIKMDTPFGSEVWKITIPAGNDTGFAGCRVITNSFMMNYDDSPYSYYTYVSGDIDDIHIYPTGTRSRAACNPTPSRDIGRWKCFSDNGGSSTGGEGNTYMAYYAKTKVSKDTVFYISALQIENKAWSSSYVEGFREATTLEYSMKEIGIEPLGDWTIAGWFKRWPDAEQWGALFGMGNYYLEEESEFQIWTNHSSSVKLHSHDNKSGRTLTVFTPNSGELDDWFYVAVTHEKETDMYHIYMWTKDRYITKDWYAPHRHPIADRLYIGANGGGRRLNGLVDELRIDDTVRNEKELMTWRYSNSPFWPRGVYRTSE